MSSLIIFFGICVRKTFHSFIIFVLIYLHSFSHDFFYRNHYLFPPKWRRLKSSDCMQYFIIIAAVNEFTLPKNVVHESTHSNVSAHFIGILSQFMLDLPERRVRCQYRLIASSSHSCTPRQVFIVLVCLRRRRPFTIVDNN